MHLPLEQLRQDPSVLLALAQTDRRTAVELFSRLSVEEQQALIARADDEGKKELLFLERDCTQLAQSLPVQQMHQAMEAATASESDVLLEILRPEQLVYMLDVQCWKGEDIDPGVFLTWLTRINASTESVVTETIARADTDLLAKGLRAFACGNNVSREEIQLALDMGSSYTFAPSDIDWDDEAAEEFFTRLYSVSSHRFSELCMKLIYDPPEQVDFNAYVAHRLRRKRASAPDTHATTALYARDAVRAELATPLGVETTEVAPWSPKSYLEKAMAHAAASETHTVDPVRLSRQIDDLLARVSIADGRGLSAHERRTTSEKAALYVSLGLEHRSHGHVDTAAQLLAEAEPVELFRTGHTLVSNLHAKARKVRKHLQRRGMEPTVEHEAALLNAALDVPRRIRADRSSHAIASVADVQALHGSLDGILRPWDTGAGTR
jgi:hypothetical protein